MFDPAPGSALQTLSPERLIRLRRTVLHSQKRMHPIAAAPTKNEDVPLQTQTSQVAQEKFSWPLTLAQPSNGGRGRTLTPQALRHENFS